MADQRTDNSLKVREAARLLRASEAKAGDDWDQEITAVTEVPPVLRPKADSTVDPEELNTVSKNIVGVLEVIPPQHRVFALALLLAALAGGYVLYQVF